MKILSKTITPKGKDPWRVLRKGPLTKKRKPEERAPDNKGSNKDPLPGKSGQKKTEAKNKGAITEQKSKKPKKRTPDAKTTSDISLKMVLVDDDKDKGKVDSKAACDIESKILERFLAQDDVEDFSSDERGRRVYTFLDESSMKFMVDSFNSLGLDNERTRLIPYCEKDQAGHPRGWIWIKLPHIKKDSLIDMIQKQNKTLDIKGKWSVLREGKKRDYGQFFLLHIDRQSLPDLKEKNFEVRTGFGVTTIKLEGKVRLFRVPYTIP
ncbi:hypothetical protein ACFFRR_009985 [Megaselia abdita]